jgi:hypothetical protein
MIDLPNIFNLSKHFLSSAGKSTLSDVCDNGSKVFSRLLIAIKDMKHGKAQLGGRYALSIVQLKVL